MDNYRLAVGQRVTIEIGWGHGFAKKEVMRKGVFKRITRFHPTGKRLALDRIDDAHYSFVPRAPGCYAVGAEINPGFMTKTTPGPADAKQRGLITPLTACASISGRRPSYGPATLKALSASVAHPLEITPWRTLLP